MNIATIPQSMLLRKISAHFKHSCAKVLEAAIVEDGILLFPVMETSELAFDPMFYPVAGKFNLGQVMDPKKFQKSQLFQNWMNVPDDIIMSYYTGGSVLAVHSNLMQQGLAIKDGQASIVLNYDYIKGGMLYISTMQNFLKVHYPLPPSD